MKLRTIQQVFNLKQKRVLLRCDLNIEPTKGTFGQTDLWRLRAVIPTIQYLMKRGAAVILVAHRGRPNGVDHDKRLAPVIKRLSSMLKRQVPVWTDDLHHLVEPSKKMRPGSVVALENIRFYPGEEENDALFARTLSRLGDLYVDDAFGNIHRSHASMVAITRYLPSYAGQLLQFEVGHLYDLLDHARHPIIAMIGGVKISTKIRLIKRLMRRVDNVLLGGALANNVLAAMEHQVGKSVVEADMVEWSKGLLSNKLHVPVDARVATSLTAKSRISAVAKVKKSEMILDIGPDTIELYRGIITAAKTIIWNGPLGFFEDPRYAQSTNEMVTFLSRSSVRSYIGGGETVKAVLAQGAEDTIHFISTGGGAMLALLEGRPLPALRALIKR